jgi:hypothetical protein
MSNRLKYRIIQCDRKYYAEVKYPWWPFWCSINWHYTEELAMEYIKDHQLRQQPPKVVWQLE